MAEQILPPEMSAFLQQSLSPQRQMQLTLEAAMRAGLLGPGMAGDDQSVMAEPAQAQQPMLPTLTGAENAGPPAPPMPPLGQRLASLAQGAVTPFTPTPPPMQTTRMVPTLGGGRELPVNQTTRFAADSPGDEAIGGMLGAAPAFGAGARALAPVARAAAQHPTMAGMLAAGGLTAATQGETQQPAGMSSTQRDNRIKELQADIAKREKILEGFATKNFQSKTAREAASQPHLDAISASRTEIRDIRTGVEAQEAARRQAEADKTWNESGITQRYPWLVPAMGTAGFAGGSALSNSIARNAVRRYNTNVNDLNTRWGGAVDTARNARTQGGRDAGVTQAESFRDQFRGMTQGPERSMNPSTWFGHGGPRTGGATLAPVAGTEIGVGLPTLADEWMAYSTPHGSPAREHSRQFWSDPASIAGRFAPGILAGSATGKVMGMAAKRNVSEPLGFYGETSALRHLPPLGRPPGPPSPPPAAPTPTPSGSPPTTPMSQPTQPPSTAAPPTTPTPSTSSSPSTRSRSRRDTSEWPEVEGYRIVGTGPHRRYQDVNNSNRFVSREELANPHQRPDRLTRGQ